MSLPHFMAWTEPLPNHDAIVREGVVKAKKGGHLGV